MTGGAPSGGLTTELPLLSESKLSRSGTGATALEEAAAGAVSCTAGVSTRRGFIDASFAAPERSISGSEVRGVPCWTSDTIMVPTIKMKAPAPETIPNRGASAARGNRNDDGHNAVSRLYATERVAVGAAILRMVGSVGRGTGLGTSVSAG